MKLHEDDRRLLIDWSDAYDIATCKIVKVKQDCVLGEHYHKLKNERFMLIQGSAEIQLNDKPAEPMKIGLPVLVSANTRHKFTLSKGSILLCLVDKPYDPNDDYEST